MTACNVDVVIPVFNGERYIVECLESILAQTFPPTHIIVSDDGSQDRTAAIVGDYARKYPHILFLPHRHGGVSSARNRGIRASHAVCIAFCDADDVWLPDKLEKQMALIASTPETTGAVHCSYCHINNDGSPRPQDIAVPPQKRGRIFTDMLFHGYVLSGSASATVVRRAALDDVGYFDEQLFLGEDADVWIRIAEKYDWDFCMEELVKIRVHSASAQRRRDRKRDVKIFFQRLILFGKWYGRIPFPPHLVPELRSEAARICLRRLFMPWSVLGLYRQLKCSNIALARDIFRNFYDYCTALIPLATSAIVSKIKHLIFKVLLRHDHQRTFRRPR